MSTIYRVASPPRMTYAQRINIEPRTSTHSDSNDTTISEEPIFHIIIGFAAADIQEVHVSREGTDKMKGT